MRTGSPPVIIVGEPRQELGRDRELGFWGVGWEDGRSGETRKRNGRGQQTRPNVPNTKGLANLRWALVGLWLFEADPVWLGAACRGELHWSVCCPCAGKRRATGCQRRQTQHNHGYPGRHSTSRATSGCIGAKSGPLLWVCAAPKSGIGLASPTHPRC